MDFARFLWELLLSNLHLVSALLALYLVVALAHREAARSGVPQPLLNRTESWVLIGVVVGARLADVLPAWDLYARSPMDLLRVNLGLSFYGALGGTAAVLALGDRRWGLPFWTMADAYALFAPLGIAAHRFTCLLYGDCGGKPASPPLGLPLPGFSQPRYPSDLYEGVLTLALLGGLLLLSARRARPGVIAGVFLVAYPLARALVSITRLSPSTTIAEAAAPALVLAAIGAGVLALRLRGRDQRPAASDEADALEDRE